MKRLILALLFALPAYGQISCNDGDCNIVTAEATGAASVSVSVTVAAGSNKLLWIFCGSIHSGGSTVPSSVVFNTTETATAIASELFGGSNEAMASAWYVKEPSVTTANATCTAAASRDNIWIGVVVLNGVDQTTVHRTPCESEGGSGSSTWTCAVTSVAGDWVIEGLTGWNQTLEADASQTELFDVGVGSDGIYGSRETASGVSTTMSGTKTLNDWSVQEAVALIPAVTANIIPHYYYR